MDQTPKKDKKFKDILRQNPEAGFFLFFVGLVLFSWPYLVGFVFTSVFATYLFYYFSWLALVLIILIIS